MDEMIEVMARELERRGPLHPRNLAPCIIAALTAAGYAVVRKETPEEIAAKVIKIAKLFNDAAG